MKTLIIMATGTKKREHHRRALAREGRQSPARRAVTDSATSVNSPFRVGESTEGRQGDAFIFRPSTAEWISNVAGWTKFRPATTAYP